MGEECGLWTQVLIEIPHFTARFWLLKYISVFTCSLVLDYIEVAKFSDQEYLNH